MSVENFLASWKIVECVNISNAINAPPANIEGAVFTLQENGEIRWELPPHVDKTFPLFQCDCYEVVYSFVGVSIQMGAVSMVFEFWVDRPVPRDLMLLTFEGWCMIQCQQITSSPTPLDFSFSFLPALTEGFFSDIVLNPQNEDSIEGKRSSNASLITNPTTKEYKLHSVILELTGTKLEELSPLPNDVLETVLYFLYAQSLPKNLSHEVAKNCIQYAPSRMNDFISLCKDYIHRTKLRKKIVRLVNKVHSSAEQMLQAFRNNCVTTPSKFCHVIKLALRHASVAFITLVEVCVLYGEEAPKLNRDERLEILRYAKARLPIFLTQFVALSREIKNDFSTVKPSDRNEISTHCVPEIEQLLESLVNLMREARDSCNDIWARWSASSSSNSSSTDSFGRYWNVEGANEDNCDRQSTESGSSISSELSHPNDKLTDVLYAIFRKRELFKLHSVQSQVVAVFAYLAQKKENFEEMAMASKIRCVSRNLEQLIEELPVFLLRIEEIMVAVDDRFQWKDFKFCLQLAISQVCTICHHLRAEREGLSKFFTTLVDLVQSDDFYQSMVNLKLIVKEKESTTEESETANDQKQTNPLDRLGVSMDNLYDDDEDEIGCLLTQVHGIHSDKTQNDLNLISRICTPKKSKESILAQNAEQLLFSSTHSDMTFEISHEKLEIPSHRVIVASRCQWFQRALLSGMKESLTKRICIHDCSVQVFQEFLRYIYVGQIGSEVSTENLSELIALADRYEIDSLKLTCEQELSLRHLDENTVIFLLSMADQYNARSLRRACISYVSANPAIMHHKFFEMMSPELQMEVYDQTMWSKANRKVFATTDELLSCPRYMLVPDSPSSSDSSSSPHSGGAVEQEEEEDLTTPFVEPRRHHHHHRHHKHKHSHSRSRHSRTRTKSPNPDANTTSTTAASALDVNETTSSNIGEGTDGSSETKTTTTSTTTTDTTTTTCSEQNKSEDEGTSNIHPDSVKCLSQLRDVLGHEISDDELQRICLAADYDVNRALNFFFSKSNSNV